MAALEPIFTTVIAAVGGGVGVTVLRYFSFFRKNRVEDRTTETERLEAENKRANARADKAEADEQAALFEWRKTRRELFDSEEYVSVLRAFIHSKHMEPPERGK